MEKIYLIIAITLLCSTVLLAMKNYLIEERYEFLKNDYSMLEHHFKENQKKLTNYTLTSIELNNICDQFPRSKKAKAKNEKLQTLLNELN